jgi:hypothetical protein
METTNTDLTCEEFIALAKKEAMEQRLKETDDAYEYFKKIFPLFERIQKENDICFEICGYSFKPCYFEKENKRFLEDFYVFCPGPHVTDLKSFGEYVLWHEKVFPKPVEVKFNSPAPEPSNEAYDATKPRSVWWKFWK